MGSGEKGWENQGENGGKTRGKRVGKPGVKSGKIAKKRVGKEGKQGWKKGLENQEKRFGKGGIKGKKLWKRVEKGWKRTGRLLAAPAGAGNGSGRIFPGNCGSHSQGRAGSGRNRSRIDPGIDGASGNLRGPRGHQEGQGQNLGMIPRDDPRKWPRKGGIFPPGILFPEWELLLFTQPGNFPCRCDVEGDRNPQKKGRIPKNREINPQGNERRIPKIPGDKSLKSQEENSQNPRRKIPQIPGDESTEVGESPKSDKKNSQKYTKRISQNPRRRTLEN